MAVVSRTPQSLLGLSSTPIILQWAMVHWGLRVIEETPAHNAIRRRGDYFFAGSGVFVAVAAGAAGFAASVDLALSGVYH